MEDEEEIQSHSSPASESHSPSSGRITVTVAAAAPPSPSNPPPSQNQTSLALALPIQQSSRPSSGSGSGGGGREDCWSEGATSVLIDAWGERYMELSRGNLKQKHWQEVADIVSSRDDYTKPPKTDIQCKNRIDTVKKKYKIEKAKVASGSGPSRWPFFDRLDRLIGPTATAAKVASTVTVTATAAPSTAAQKAAAVPQQQQQLFRRGAGMAMAMPPPESDSEPEEEWSRDSGDSLPPETPFERRKRPRVEVNNVGINRGKAREKGSMGKWGNSVRELTRAILKFGEAYEAAESAKLQQIVEMEKQRMKFAKELELQRIKFLMKTQLELSQLNANGNNNSDSRGGGSSGRRGGGGSAGGGGGGGGVESNHHNHLENHLSHANSDSSN
ncbi:hypothetical protein Cgig2_006984 [Carnegiea gigantea]|uniref:Myb/SANT-like DNA-binding domain-containing protein n=1 Tax=Carnegiea gigantea TaxID=171969 RepID=A0A9Q1KCT7_9CARY|nr:hypothetical protein Cgig2_006984 [Carnegiea gigantea]